jgi:hypothetical protein
MSIKRGSKIVAPKGSNKLGDVNEINTAMDR